MNCMVVESGGDRVVIDCGLMFPNAEQALGVEVIAPDLSYLKAAESSTPSCSPTRTKTMSARCPICCGSFPTPPSAEPGSRSRW